jgi:hypothetical protein
MSFKLITEYVGEEIFSADIHVFEDQSVKMKHLPQAQFEH